MFKSQYILMILMTSCVLYTCNKSVLKESNKNKELGPKPISTKVDNNKLLLEWLPVDGANGYLIDVTVSNSLYLLENHEPFSFSARTNSYRIDMERFISKPATNYNISIQSFVKREPNSYDLSSYNYTIYKTSPIAPIIQINNETCDNSSCFVSMRVKNVQFGNSSLCVFLMNETTSTIQYHEKVVALINSERNSSNFGYFMNPQNISSPNLTMETTKIFKSDQVCFFKIIIIALNQFNGEIKHDFYEPQFNFNCKDVELPKEVTNWQNPTETASVSFILLLILLILVGLLVICVFCYKKRDSLVIIISAIHRKLFPNRPIAKK